MVHLSVILPKVIQTGWESIPNNECQFMKSHFFLNQRFYEHLPQETESKEETRIGSEASVRATQQIAQGSAAKVGGTDGQAGNETTSHRTGGGNKPGPSATQQSMQRVFWKLADFKKISIWISLTTLQYILTYVRAKWVNKKTINFCSTCRRKYAFYKSK